VLISDPFSQLAYSWEAGCSADARTEPASRVTFDLEPRGKTVKLTVKHDNLEAGGNTLRNVSNGWPIVIAGLKSLLETGHVLDIEPPSAAEKAAVHA
jgi:hypothetical protein